MNDHVRKIQAALKQAGLYEGGVDGIAGDLTVKAVEAALAGRQPSEPSSTEAPTLSDGTTSGFTLSSASTARLAGVNDNLVQVVKRALTLSSQDFLVLEGVRSKERQAELVKKGASQTMNSKHITGHAVDLVPIIDGAMSWEWVDFYPIAEAMRMAAKELGVKVRWGGAWDVTLNDTDMPTKGLVENYTASRRRQGKKAFIDGPHFELV